MISTKAAFSCCTIIDLSETPRGNLMKTMTIVLSLFLSLFISTSVLAGHGHHHKGYHKHMHHHNCHQCGQKHHKHYRACNDAYKSCDCKSDCLYRPHVDFAGLECSVSEYGGIYVGRINSAGQCAVYCDDAVRYFEYYTILVR